MRMRIELTQEEVRIALLNYMREASGLTNLTLNDISIKVRSDQNYRNKEWEQGEIQVLLER